MEAEKFELFPYQKEGAEWLFKRRFALLADEMGLGKSAQVITAADRLGLDRILVVCPAVVRINWEREFQKFSNRKRNLQCVLPGGEKPESDSLICSYDFASSYEWGKWSFDLLVLDEAHFLKNIEAKRARAVFGKNGLVRQSTRVWALSGTPAPNHVGELWILLYTFGVTHLSYVDFCKRYCNTLPSNFGRFGFSVMGTNEDRIPELQALLRKVMLRRRKVDVLPELPPIFYSHIAVEAGEVDLEMQQSFFQWIFPKDRKKELEEELQRQNDMLDIAVNTHGAYANESLKLLAAMANSISTLRRYTGLQKVEKTAELLDDELFNRAYEKVVIFCWSVDVVRELQRRLEKYKVVTLYGNTPVQVRQHHIDQFERGKARVLVANILAAGTGINLTSCNQVVFLEQDWVPANNAQAVMRCHRIGQKHSSVHVRFIGLRGSLDDKIADTLKRKTRELTRLFDDKASFSEAQSTEKSLERLLS